MGHGNEGFKTRIPIEDADTPEIIAEKSKDLIPDLIPVPKGSIVVIKSHSGDVRFGKDVSHDYVITLTKSLENIILDPIANIDSINQFFGSVAIYREGDLCPNLSHSVIAKWDKTDHFLFKPSGVVSIPLKNPMDDHDLFKYIYSYIKVPKSMTIKEYKQQRDSGGFNLGDMLKLHTGSSGKNILLTTTEKKLDEEDQNKTFGEVFENIYEFNTIQEDIFELKPNCITYAFNCRFINDHEDLVPEYVRLGLKSNENIQQMELRQKKPNFGLKRFSGTRNLTKKLNSIKRVNNRKPVRNVAPEIKEQIRESVLQRRLGAVAYAKANKTRRNLEQAAPKLTE